MKNLFHQQQSEKRLTSFPVVGTTIATLFTAAIISENVSASTAPDNTVNWQNKGWELVWQDEFNEGKVDPSKWSYEQNCWGGGNDEQQCYVNHEENFVFKDGILHITAIKQSHTGPADVEDSPNYSQKNTRTLPYTSGRLRSKGKADFKYGRFEARIKLPSGQGTWPAFWMLPTDNVYGGWAASGEIDIMEAVNLGTQSDEKGVAEGTPETRIHGTLHYGASWPKNVYSGTSYRLSNLENPADDFHTYAVEWEEGEIRWYMNDVHYATQRQDGWYSQFTNEAGEVMERPDAAPFDQPFHILLNLAVGGNWAANVNQKGIDATVFPQKLSIDYVRVYQCKKDPDTGKGCASISPDAKLVSRNSDH